MWKKLKQTTTDLVDVFKHFISNEDTEDNEECLRRLENVLNKSIENDMQMISSGQWVSKRIIEAISAETKEQSLLKICGQNEVSRLDTIFDKRILRQMEKLWSGCYSEVFKMKNLNGEDIILKISLIDRLSKEGLVVQNISSIVSDVINSKRLSDLKRIPVESTANYCENFADIKSFLYGWSEKSIFNKSEFKGRHKKSKFEYFISIQTFGGKELDLISGLSPSKGLSLVLQLIASIAVAEESINFEHRDLHTSNLLVKRTDQKYAFYSISGQKFRIELNSIKIVIIDTTFARTDIKVSLNDGKQKRKYIYNDLSRLNLDGYPNSQLKQVYVQQKQIVDNKWKQFCPKTNTIWLNYCIHRIIEKVDNWCQQIHIKPDTTYSYHSEQLNHIKQIVKNCDSAKELAQKCRMFSIN